MKGSQIRLKLFLDKLGIPLKITSIDDRKRIQKAVYLGKEAGFDLGYSYGWYLKGPYSPELTQDYYVLNNDIASGDKDYEKYELAEELSEKLIEIKGLMTPPKGVGLSQENWLELVASILFCKNVYNYDKDRAKKFLTKEKNHLIGYFDDAVAALKSYKLINN
jgi:uncharacterized protein YwgA